MRRNSPCRARRSLGWRAPLATILLGFETPVAAVARVNIRFRPMLKLLASAKPRRAIALCAAFAVLLVAFGAQAQSDEERAGARAAAQEGASAFREKRWSDAIDLFTRAESLVHSP